MGGNGPVYLTLKSADVCHSFWVPRLAGKTDLIPGKTNHMWFESDQTGLFLGQCAEYCGTQHAKMLLRVQVDTPENFARWLEEQKKAVDDAASSDEREGGISLPLVRQLPSGRRHSAAGTYAPDLSHLMDRKTLASGIVLNDDKGENLKRWIADPQKLKPGCLMPAFGLSESELNDIVDVP